MAECVSSAGVEDQPFARVAVWGAASSGKTTLARRLAAAIGAPYLELDAVHWGPNWTPISADQFLARVAAFAAAERWVMDGEYFTKAADVVLARADALVWLDYGLALLLGRLLRRRIRRVARREVLWNGNRETLRGAVFSADSLFAYLLKSERRKRATREQRAADLENGGVRGMRIRTPQEAERWLARMDAVRGMAQRE